MGLRRPVPVAAWAAGACIAVALPFMLVLAMVSHSLQALAAEWATPAPSHTRALQHLHTQLHRVDAQLSLLPPTSVATERTDLTAASQALAAVEAGRGLAASRALQPAATDWRRLAQSAGVPVTALQAQTQQLIGTLDPLMAPEHRHSAVPAVRLQERLQRLQRLLLAVALAVLPLTALLLMALARQIQRGQQQLIQHMLALGEGRHGQPFTTTGFREWQRLGQQLERLRRRWSFIQGEQGRFLQLIAHDLKTPLVSVREGAALLREGRMGTLSPQQREVVEILSDSAADLEQLIGKLLTPTPVRLEAAPEWFEVSPFIDAVLSAHRLPLSARSLRIERRLRSARIYGRRDALRAALDNLLANALKHAPANTAVVLEAAVRSGHFELSVRDYGRGVPALERVRIFEPFVRGAGAASERVQGSGLGLAIVREVAESHGGEVQVEDARPGARFCLRWPVPSS